MCRNPSEFLRSGRIHGRVADRQKAQSEPPRFSATRPTALASLLLLLVTLPALAHGPYDHSARLFVGGDKLELMVTMGTDAAQGFLTGAGHASSVKGVLSRTAGQTPFELPLELVPRLFKISSSGEPLHASNVTIITDGLESIFTVAYPRLPEGTLELQAVYLKNIGPIRGGSFVAQDEDYRQLAAAPLSRGNAVVQLALPPKVPLEEIGGRVGEGAGPVDPGPADQSPTRAPTLLPQQASITSAAPHLKILPMASVALVFLAVLLVGGRVRRKRTY